MKPRRDAGDAVSSSRSGGAAGGPPPLQSTHGFRRDTTLVAADLFFVVAGLVAGVGADEALAAEERGGVGAGARHPAVPANGFLETAGVFVGDLPRDLAGEITF